MKIREGFVVREVADNIMVVPTGKLVDSFHNIINLNKVGKFIWEFLQEDHTLDEVANELVNKYKISEEQAKQDTEKFVEKLKNANVLEK